MGCMKYVGCAACMGCMAHTVCTVCIGCTRYMGCMECIRCTGCTECMKYTGCMACTGCTRSTGYAAHVACTGCTSCMGCTACTGCTAWTRRTTPRALHCHTRDTPAALPALPPARLTGHLQRQQVLLVVNAGHHLAAVQPAVAGTGAAQQQRGIGAVAGVTGQQHPPLIGFHHLHHVVLGHQDGDVLPLASGRAHFAPFDAGRVGGLVGPQRGGGLEQEEAGKGHGLPQPHAHSLVLYPVDVDHLPIVLGACRERCPDTTGMGGGTAGGIAGVWGLWTEHP